ncbi:conserved hypothetical protein [Leishmania major strain Friedlin]|uniref:Uncharacterized protein n=1 Tax=Leishmania major TaxID=5664 RepID=Q4Q6D8_LEIMA|nr:conserved hypothetical protein [Leishmania major strain Friedlin]CAG9579290.1 hypothetical_protein_-_conserved [Leishmania major strain Friedlin]CAJ08312.1 conserved hypothetical protein [Leishmania major strain Friedlin]|eukprot:XP_001685110.1 conserved hypothetical protein [Leishmania major strain Friedlin]
MSSPSATDAPAKATIKPHRAVAFFASADRSHCLVGVVASTPTITQCDGTVAVLVQPRPLILLAPQTLQDASKGGGLVTGRLVDASDPSVSGLPTASIPSPKWANNRGSATMPLSADDVGTVMTAEELREMQEHRDRLKADLASSRDRVREIDELFCQHTQEKNSSATLPTTPNPLRAPSPLKEHLDAARKTVDDAAKAADAAEKELLLARAGLRTVKPFAWADLQRRHSGSSSQPLVSLIETAVAPLHDRACASFDDAIVQAVSFPKRLAAVKSMSVTVNDTQRALRFLKAWPTVAAVAKEHKTASALYRWIDALAKAAEAQRRLKATQHVLAATPSQSPDAAWPSKELARAPETASQPAKKLYSVAEAALRKEWKDQMEYVQMAEEELAAVDALIAEAEALAISSPHVAQGSPKGAKTIVPALVVPTSWVACALPEDEAPRIGVYTHQPRGNQIEFSSSASLILSAVAKELVPSAVVSTATPQDRTVSALNLAESRKALAGSDNNSGSNYHGTGVRRSTNSPQLSPRAAAAASTGVSNAALVPVTEVTTARQRAEDAEEKTRLLEARLSAALQQNPKEAEVQLLRDELDAKRTELRRVTEERDRLLQERCERSSRYVPLSRRATADGAQSDGASQAGSGRYARRSSTPRDTVDRSVVEELEDQLTAAHQRISELLIEAGEWRRRSPSLTAVSIAPKAAKSSRVAISHGDCSHASVLQSPSTEEMDTAPHSASDTPRQQSLRGTTVSPCRTLSSPMITQEMYDELQARLCAVSDELETQRQETHQLEEQLNDALHRRSEAEHMVLAQKHELEEVWERLEAAEARAEEQELLTQQRLLLTHTQLFPLQSQLSQLNVSIPLPSVSPIVNSNPSQTLQPTVASTRAPLQHAQHTLSVQDVLGSGSAPGAADAEVRSQTNEDAMTIATNANTVYGSASRLSVDVYPHSPGTTSGFPSFGGGGGAATSAAAAHAAERSLVSQYSRAPSALQSRPVEQLSTIELRHEVHRLREEVERYQSGELRMVMELQTLREKQKAERKRRRDARTARIQMLARMQGNIADVIEKSTKELRAIPALLERSRSEAEALMARRRMGG